MTLGTVLGTIIATGKVPAYMVKAAVTSVGWIKWAFVAAKSALIANPFAAGVIVGGTLVGIGAYVKKRYF